MVALDLRRLRFLREFEERGTLGAVAAALGYSPSTVSQQLALLEKEVGATLFARAGRGLRLTDAGRLLAGHARVLLAAAEAAEADLAALSGDIRGTVRAGGLQSAARRLLIPALTRLAGRHPRVRVEISELELEQALPSLRLGAVDLVIGDEYDGHPRPRPAGLRFTVVLAEPLRLVLPAAHPLARAGGPVAFADLHSAVWTSSAEGTGHHAMVVGTCRALGGYEPDLRHRSNDADVQLELVRAGAAVALMPPLALPVADPALAVREVAGAALGRRLMAVTRQSAAAPALHAFLDAVRAQARSIA
ncbi:LysR family transcriptional regulator [Actinoplanes sp. SE50]|uniref:LysR family transcriptional regulator n=1 Tax=unclassified Actinoplanes TaxID=2626549 RepID=UPI00023EC28C|nr:MULTISPECIES: LysR family transcriptional regulator [unclassified Actinoplanes]AEV84105.1 putative RuBisCO transcriptional regulator [Actinoplanes sp. SE50/110]ATO82497.1 LysR family transcriptional regulator [Actinoplanes sp. SE50]SLL99904.1 LysR-family transcriptional regulator [Actinoplanes sp. SE50/110]